MVSDAIDKTQLIAGSEVPNAGLLRLDLGGRDGTLDPVRLSSEQPTIFDIVGRHGSCQPATEWLRSHWLFDHI
jgi:hypothetical protein